MSLAVATMGDPKTTPQAPGRPGAPRLRAQHASPGQRRRTPAILVIDSTPGALEAGVEGTGLKGGKGQTWEHLQLARSSGWTSS